MKTILKALLFIWLIIPISCEKDDDIDDRGLPCNLNNREVPVTSLNIAIGSLDEKSHFSTVKSTDVEKAALKFSGDMMAYHSQPENNYQLSLLSKSYATPPCGTTISANYLTDISVKSNGPLFTKDSVYDSGTEIKDFFQISLHNISFISVDEFVNKNDTLNNNRDRFGGPTSLYIFKCINAVDSLTDQKLTFYFSLDDGRTIEVSTDEFEIK